MDADDKGQKEKKREFFHDGVDVSVFERDVRGTVVFSCHHPQRLQMKMCDEFTTHCVVVRFAEQHIQDRLIGQIL
jgi:hypothetical protein